LWNVGIEKAIGSSPGGTTPKFEPAGPRTEPQDFYLQASG
jgi:hypothetical protein